MGLYYKCVRCHKYVESVTMDKYTNTHQGNYTVCKTNRYEDVHLCPDCNDMLNTFIKEDFMSCNHPSKSLRYMVLWDDLRNNLRHITDNILPKGYYNMDGDVYSCNRITAEDVVKAHNSMIKDRNKWRSWSIVFIVAYFIQTLFIIFGGAV